MDTAPNVVEPSENPRSSAAEGQRPVQRIYRDPTGPIGGVAGGFAGYFDIDPVISRLSWLVALCAGVGIPAYLICWLVIPKAKVWPPAHTRPSASGSGRNGTALLSGLVIIGLLAALGAGVGGVGAYLLLAVLVGVGAYLLGQRRASGSHGAPSQAFE